MSLFQPLYTPSPYHANVRLYVGDDPELTTIPPDKLVDFSYMMTINNAANEANFTLVDKFGSDGFGWGDMEGILAPDRKGAELCFDFGYTTAGAPDKGGVPLRSPWVVARVMSVTPTFEIDHVRLGVNALSSAVGSYNGEGGQCEIKFDWGPETEITWDEGEENLLGKITGHNDSETPTGTPRKYEEGITICQIVQEIAWKHKLIPVVDCTEPILARSYLEATDAAPKTWTQAGSSDFAFIKNQLLDSAMSKETKDGGFTLYVTDTLNNVTSLGDVDEETLLPKYPPGYQLHFHPKRRQFSDKIRTQPKFFYLFPRGQGSSVISLSLDLMGFEAVGVGGGGEAVPSNDQVTGYRTINFFDNLSTPDKFILDKATTHLKSNQNPAKWAKTLVTYLTDSAHGYATGRQRYIDMFDKTIGCTLVVMGHPPGDPIAPDLARAGPQVNDLIFIMVAKPDGTPHYASGIYWIETLTHTIQGGTYTMTLKCFKNAVRDSASNKIMTEEALGTVAEGADQSAFSPPPR